MRVWMLALAFVSMCLPPPPVRAADAVPELTAVQRAGWEVANTLAQALAVSEAKRFPGMHAWLKELRAAGGLAGAKPSAAPPPALNAERLVARSSAFWRAYFEILPGDAGGMLLHAGLLLAAGEISRGAYLLVVARQNPDISQPMRDAIDRLLGLAQDMLARAARDVADAVKLHDAGDPTAAAARLRELIVSWPANALAHYELGLALLAQEYRAAGQTPPSRARLSIHSERRPAQATLDHYARARAHDPLLIRAYQGNEISDGNVLLILGKRVRPSWDAVAQDTKGEVPDETLRALADALRDIGAAELALATRQVLIGREGGFDADDRQWVTSTVRRLTPEAAEAIGKRLASPKAEFLRTILP